MSIASANSWGLTGDLFTAVSATDTWNDYTAESRQVGDIAVMHSRYHNTLMLLEGKSKTLRAYTTAVYQPGTGRNKALLAETTNGFILAYGDVEHYTFWLADGVYELHEAQIGDFRLYPSPDNALLGYNHRFIASDGKQSAELRQYITLDNFNIQLFPRSVEEVRHLNLMRASMQIAGNYCLGWTGYPNTQGDRHYTGFGTGTTPVYSAPYGEAAWRAANGKASVGLQGEIWQLFLLQNESGDGYACIRYNVSNRTQRIGYIDASALSLSTANSPTAKERFQAIDVVANQQTYLTDDPDVSQYPQIDIPEGTRLTCFGLYSPNYAYVEAHVQGDTLAQDGAVIWGFIPIKALSFRADDPYRSAVQDEVMSRLFGEWVYSAGGSMAGDHLVFNADGTFVDWYLNPDSKSGAEYTQQSGTWAVTLYNPAWRLYWAGVEYELTLRYDSGVVNVKGLLFFNGGFSLVNDEGSGGYMHPEDFKNNPGY